MKRIRIFAAVLALFCAAPALAQQIGTYPPANTPLLGTEQMVGNQAASYPCVACTKTITPSMIAGYTASLAAPFSILYNNNGVIAGLIPSATGQYCLDWWNLDAAPALVTCTGGGGMVYPGAGIPNSTGTAWGTSYSTTGSGNVVLSTSPTLITPALGTPSAIVLTNATGLPLSGLTGLGTGVGAALGVNTGSAGSFVVNGGALGTPSSGVGTNITGVDAASVGGFTLPCTVPSLVTGDYLTNDGTTCSWSAVSGSGVTLQTNGTNNLSQTTLNLVNGGGLTFTNTSGGNVTASVNAVPRIVTTSTDTISCTNDNNGAITYDYTAGTVAVTLPQATGSCGNGFGFTVQNMTGSGGAVTFTTTTSTINGSSSPFSVGTNSGASFISEGGNWYVFACTACSSGGGATENVQSFTANGTWNKPTGSPQLTKVTCTGGGAGGGSGAFEPSGTEANGGSGGGGGSQLTRLFQTSALPSSVTVTIGTGGNGGTAVTAAGPGTNGVTGGNTTFGTYLTAYGGVYGPGGNTAAANNGGGGAGLLNHAIMCNANGNSASPNPPGCAEGGAAGGGNGTTGGAGNNGGSSVYGAAGGGSGGSLATSPVASAGGNGGASQSSTGGAGGSASAGGVGSQVAYDSGSGGGGGASALTGAAFAGGAGIAGSGGGGGGAGCSSGGSCSATSSGAGGAGGNGFCVVITTY